MKKIVIALFASVLLMTSAVNAAKPKILFVDSYHKGYPWSDGIADGIYAALKIKVDQNGKVDDSKALAELKIHYMDTKRNKTEEFKKEAAIKSKALIESWKPDVVIAGDDNAAKYLIVPYYKNKDLPFVFCGVNWDASSYGFPCKNVTGMLEVALIPNLLKTMKTFAKGDKLGYLSADTMTNKKEAENYRTNFKLELNEMHVKTGEEWKKAFVKLQNECDMVIIGNDSGIEGYDLKEAVAFAEENTKVPTGNIYDWLAPAALVSYAKVASEQGEWSAVTALKIVNGTSPKDIPIVKNKKGKLFLNLRIAKKIGVKFPLALIKQATVIK